jgi:hypothetical protein
MTKVSDAVPEAYYSFDSKGAVNSPERGAGRVADADTVGLQLAFNIPASNNEKIAKAESITRLSRRVKAFLNGVVEIIEGREVKIKESGHCYAE